MEKMEQPISKIEKIEPKLVLRFLRHSKKERVLEEVEDKDIPLSVEGRDLAAIKYETPLDFRYGHVVGSPRIRTQETGAVAATQNSETILEDLGVGKVRVDESLDFFVDDTLYGKRFHKAYAEGNLMSFIVHESDIIAKETEDVSSSTYSRMAANIARIIYRNFEIASRGASVLAQSENTENKQNDFERIIATHAGIQESFLFKVVEVIKGREEREALLSLIGETGVDFTEGFDVILSKENGEEKIRIVYKKGEYVFDEVVSADSLKRIIEEGE
ncbi:MAG: hypothetical protein WCG73_00870 [Candidatus Moraniibacteriota bacterium]